MLQSRHLCQIYHSCSPFATLRMFEILYLHAYILSFVETALWKSQGESWVWLEMCGPRRQVPLGDCFIDLPSYRLLVIYEVTWPSCDTKNLLCHKPTLDLRYLLLKKRDFLKGDDNFKLTLPPAGSWKREIDKPSIVLLIATMCSFSLCCWNRLT